MENDLDNELSADFVVVNQADVELEKQELLHEIQAMRTRADTMERDLENEARHRVKLNLRGRRSEDSSEGTANTGAPVFGNPAGEDGSIPTETIKGD